MFIQDTIWIEFLSLLTSRHLFVSLIQVELNFVFKINKRDTWHILIKWKGKTYANVHDEIVTDQYRDELIGTSIECD